MSVFSFKHVCIESVAVNLPPLEVTTTSLEDRLAPLYNRLEIPFGTLERLCGIKTRYFFDNETSPSQAGSVAAETALARISFPVEKIGAVVNCSVTRDYFEPSTAILVHGNLRLPETALTFDISNACIGFSNGLQMLGMMIESGVIEAGIVVSAECVSKIVDHSVKQVLSSPDLTREALLKLIPTFTLGSGAVAYVICHERLASKPHRVLGSAARSASQFSDLCIGNGDFCFLMDEAQITPVMETESSKLIKSASTVGKRVWEDFQHTVGWTNESYQHLVSHQVGKQQGEVFFKAVGIDGSKEFSTYNTYGNQVSAAMPSAFVLGTEKGVIKENSHTLLTAYGSGINASFTGIKW